MDKLVPEDVLKVLQGLLLPLELKINSLLDAVRSLEAKIDDKNSTEMATKEGKQKSLQGDRVLAGPRQHSTSSCAMAVTGSRTPTTQRADPKTFVGVVTRKQRALAATSNPGPVQLQLPAQPQPQLPRPQESEARVAPPVSNVPNIVTSVVSTPIVSNALNAEVLEISAHDSQQWRVVRGRQRRPPMKGAGEVDSELATVEKTRQIHLWLLRNDVTVEQVQSYMRKKCSTAAPYVVEKLQLKHTNYASFVVTVPESLFDFFMTAKNWPPNIEFNEWFRRRAAKGNGDTNRPFSQ